MKLKNHIWFGKKKSMQINCISCTCETVAPCSFIGYEFISIQGIRIIIIFRLLVMVHVYTKAKAISYPVRTEFISNPFFCVCKTTDSIAQKKKKEKEKRIEERPGMSSMSKRSGKKALEPPSLAEPPPPRWRHAFYANSAGLDDDDACCCTVKGLQPEDGIERPTSLVEGSTLSPNSVLHRKSNGSVEFEASRKNFVKLWWLVIGK